MTYRAPPTLDDVEELLQELEAAEQWTVGTFDWVSVANVHITDDHQLKILHGETMDWLDLEVSAEQKQRLARIRERVLAEHALAAEPVRPSDVISSAVGRLRQGDSSTAEGGSSVAEAVAALAPDQASEDSAAPMWERVADNLIAALEQCPIEKWSYAGVDAFSVALTTGEGDSEQKGTMLLLGDGSVILHGEYLDLPETHKFKLRQFRAKLVLRELERRGTHS